MTVRRCDTFHTIALSPLTEDFIDVLLLGNGRVLKLEKEVFAESLFKPLKRLNRGCFFTDQGLIRDLTSHTARKDNEPISVLIEQLTVNHCTLGGLTLLRRRSFRI